MPVKIPSDRFEKKITTVEHIPPGSSRRISPVAFTVVSETEMYILKSMPLLSTESDYAILNRDKDGSFSVDMSHSQYKFERKRPIDPDLRHIYFPITDVKW